MMRVRPLHTEVLFLTVFAVVLSCACIGLGIFASVASADEEQTTTSQTEDIEGELDNTIDPTQMPDSSFLYDVSIADLAGADSYYDRQTVQVVGEALGDIIGAETNSGYVWVLLGATETGSDATVTVYMTKEQASLIDTLGSYRVTGTKLQVRGIFNLVCAEHGGISDVHAEHVSVTARGTENKEEFSVSDFFPGAVAVCVGFLLVGIYLALRERQR